jgi:hypothetical protein
MTSITARTIARRPSPVAQVAVERPAVEDDHQPLHDVPGPDERSLARTTAAVVTSLVLLIGTMALVAYGAGSMVTAVTEWFLSR